jgi:hypothetical protein
MTCRALARRLSTAHLLQGSWQLAGPLEQREIGLTPSCYRQVVVVAKREEHWDQKESVQLQGRCREHCWLAAELRLILCLLSIRKASFQSIILSLHGGKAPRQELVLSSEGIQSALKLLYVSPRLLPWPLSGEPILNNSDPFLYRIFGVVVATTITCAIEVFNSIHFFLEQSLKLLLQDNVRLNWSSHCCYFDILREKKSMDVNERRRCNLVAASPQHKIDGFPTPIDSRRKSIQIATVMESRIWATLSINKTCLKQRGLLKLRSCLEHFVPASLVELVWERCLYYVRVCYNEQ